ncbi:MAG: RNA methyltransferase [Bacteroidales bacterium]|nr:RNA methyltransferase [Bacteroidales bacterium]
MLSKSSIRFIRSLKTGKFRETSGLFIAEGTKTVLDLLESSLAIHSIYATQDWIARYSDHLGKAADRWSTITEKEMKAVSALVTPQDVLALVEIPDSVLVPSALAGELILMLDEIRDPGNLGTIIRTADWFGIRHLLCSTGCVDAYNPKVVQSSMGSLARVHVHSIVLKDFLDLHNPGLTVYGCLLDGMDIHQVPLGKTGIILLGNESTGISPELLPYVQVRLTIPSFPPHAGISPAAPESLNAAQACSIVCYAFRS